MASAVRKDEGDFRKRPLISAIVSPTSPLQITEEASEIAIECGDKGVPVLIAPTPICGATSPVTMAGSLIQQNMEFLAVATLIQIASPGSAVLYAPRCCPMDMRSGMPSFGSIEFAILSAAAVQISHYYGIAVDAHGPTTNSKMSDIQSGFEKGPNGIYPVLAGSEMISGSGSVEFCGTSSLIQLLIDDEYYGTLSRAVQGLKVDGARMAKDIIEKVGYDGHYLSERHTREFYKQEYRLSQAFDAMTRVAWERDGSKDLLQRSEAEIRRILKEAPPQILERDVQSELERILREAWNELSVHAS
jgi:trimethylamine--corrinoid protein Co-methyltransferase